MSCMDEIIIDKTYKAFKKAQAESTDSTLTEFDRAARTTRLSPTLSLIKNSKNSTTFMALIKLPNEKTPRRQPTGKNTIQEATVEAIKIEQTLLAKMEAGTLDVKTELSWRYICVATAKELDVITEATIKEAMDKGKKRSQVKPQSQAHARIINNKLKDNKYLASKKVTELQYADFYDAFTCEEFRGLKKTPRNNTLKAIGLVFEYAQKNRLISGNQIPQIPELSFVSDKERPIITSDDLDVIMTNFQNFYENNPSMNYITEARRRILPFYITVLSSCGLRPGAEVIEIKWSHLTKGLVKVTLPDGTSKKIEAFYADITGGKMSRRTKDGGLKLIPHSREIVIYSEAAKAIEGLYFIQFGENKSLAEIVDEDKDELMFAGADKRLIEFGDVFKQYIEFLGNKLSQSYVPYCFRHEFINSQLDRGVNIDDIAEQCGTSAPTINKSYKKYKAMNRAARILSNEDIEYFMNAEKPEQEKIT